MFAIKDLHFRHVTIYRVNAIVFEILSKILKSCFVSITIVLAYVLWQGVCCVLQKQFLLQLLETIIVVMSKMTNQMLTILFQAWFTDMYNKSVKYHYFVIHICAEITIM